ncbi:MAG: signal recognition particle-docking protein FtsY [Ignavibacteriales bacterium]|nr:signal recognition particle-docking protein FtsY [Ignavibacteriales bacterium]
MFKNTFEKLKSGLAKTRDKIFNKIVETISGKAQLDEQTLIEIEELLLSCDIGFDSTIQIIDKVREEIKKEKDRNKEIITQVLKLELIKILENNENKSFVKSQIIGNTPFVIIIIGVNGSGKTTTVGKLAYNLKNEGFKVMIGSADTFRAAANDQLEIWVKRADVNMVQKTRGSDPSAVAYETCELALKNNSDVVLIDTAGRLHTKSNLMDELKKISNVINKLIQHAPNEIYLVIDGNTGQNGIVQAREFMKYTKITGIIITKLDGTAKGGIIFQIVKELNIPVKYIGVGEDIDDLQEFDAKEYVNALLTLDLNN